MFPNIGIYSANIQLDFFEMRLASYIVLATAALATLVGGGVLWLKDASPGGEIQLTLPAATPAPEMKVYISGAVLSPGVYAFSEGDRLADVVELAGGALADADLDAVSMASRVKDEDHWHILRLGESPASPITASSGLPSGAAPSGKININSASATELESLPGIGPTIAQRIVAYRETNGPFATVDDLINVSRIGPATLESIRDLVEAR